MSTNDYIEHVKNEFAIGKRFIELPCANPFTFRKRLYKASRRRGILWMFATSDKSVFVIATL